MVSSSVSGYNLVLGVCKLANEPFFYRLDINDNCFHFCIIQFNMYQKKNWQIFFDQYPSEELNPRLEKICEQNVNNAILEKNLMYVVFMVN